MALVIVGAMWFFFSNVVQSIQETFLDSTASDMWATSGNWNSWSLAATLVNNIWKFFLVFLVIGLIYYGYIEAQRRL
jgi:hypothetical protein